MFSFGSAEHGQLGNGKTGEHIVTAGKTAFDIEWEPSMFTPQPPKQIAYGSAIVLVKGLEEKRIVQIACGQQHSVALDSEG